MEENFLIYEEKNINLFLFQINVNHEENHNQIDNNNNIVMVDKFINNTTNIENTKWEVFGLKNIHRKDLNNKQEKENKLE